MRIVNLLLFYIFVTLKSLFLSFTFEQNIQKITSNNVVNEFLQLRLSNGYIRFYLLFEVIPLQLQLVIDSLTGIMPPHYKSNSLATGSKHRLLVLNAFSNNV